jgi:hypothetical protein
VLRPAQQTEVADQEPGERPRPPTRKDGRAALSGFEFDGELEGSEHFVVPKDRVAADAVLRDRETQRRSVPLIHFESFTATQPAYGTPVHE